MTDAREIKLESLAVLDLKPGDVVVIRVAQWLTEEQRARAREFVTKAIRDRAEVLILDGGVDLSVLRP